jgi:hypothetical protein
MILSLVMASMLDIIHLQTVVLHAQISYHVIICIAGYDLSISGH